MFLKSPSGSHSDAESAFTMSKFHIKWHRTRRISKYDKLEVVSIAITRMFVFDLLFADTSPRPKTKRPRSKLVVRVEPFVKPSLRNKLIWLLEVFRTVVRTPRAYADRRLFQLVSEWQRKEDATYASRNVMTVNDISTLLNGSQEPNWGRWEDSKIFFNTSSQVRKIISGNQGDVLVRWKCFANLFLDFCIDLRMAQHHVHEISQTASGGL